MKRHRTSISTRLVSAAVAAVALAGVATGSAAAHHSYGAAYDATRPVTVAGVVTELQYVSPHVLAHLQASEADGATARVYALDLPAPSRAQNMGLTQEALAPGTPLTVTAWPSRTNDRDLAPSHITFDTTGQTVRIR